MYHNKHFESSQKLRKDGIGILENFIENMLSNYILILYLFTVVLCFVLVYRKKCHFIKYDILNEKGWTGTEHNL